MKRPVFLLVLALPNIQLAQSVETESPGRGLNPTLSSASHDKTREQRFFDWTSLQFDKSVYAKRRAKLEQLLRSSGGGVFLTPSAHGVSHGPTFRQLDDFLYLTGLELPHSILAIDSDAGKTVLFAPRRDARFESKFRPNDFPGRPLADDPKLSRVSGISEIRPYSELNAAVTEWCKAGRVLRINSGRKGSLSRMKTDFIYDWDPADQLIFHFQRTYPSAKLENAFAEVAKMRMIKGPEEVEVIRRVCDLTVKAIKHTATFIRDGVDERRLEAELEAIYKRGGAQRLAFSSIIKSGPNSLWPWRILAAHSNRLNRQMKNGELVILDVGTELDYYVSDVGRTFPVSGTFTAEQERILEMETAVSDAIIAAIRPGITFAELTQIAVAAIPPSERKYMQTGSFFGHHIGLAVGDPSLLDEPLTPGMVFTVEPWYYNHNKAIAVFTEDVILVTKTGAENLTAALPRSPEGLERLMGR
ncbi:Xaa-Pro peptidase family protein [bacterium]|nr:Xaa-Pro peptidase family protein [bacterium]